MNFERKRPVEITEAGLEHVLRNFRDSVCAWSEAEYGRPRVLAPARMQHTRRMAMAWALGCVLMAGGLTVGLEELHHRREIAQHSAGSGAQQHRQSTAVELASNLAAGTRAGEGPVEQVATIQTDQADENLMSAVDSDVSRQVPSAMEPLAQLMDNSSSQ